jgi:hypothetical protein
VRNQARGEKLGGLQLIAALLDAPRDVNADFFDFRGYFDIFSKKDADSDQERFELFPGG